VLSNSVERITRAQLLRMLLILLIGGAGSCSETSREQSPEDQRVYCREAGFSIIPPELNNWITRARKVPGKDGKVRTVGFTFNPKTGARTHDVLVVENILQPPEIVPLPGYVKHDTRQYVIYERGDIEHGHDDFLHYVRIIQQNGTWFKISYLTYDLSVTYKSSLDDSTLPHTVKASIESFRIEDTTAHGGG
jgi:hypothetical protein